MDYIYPMGMVGLLEKCAGLASRVVGEDAGGVAVYTAFFSMLAIGAGALVLDVGRLSVLRSQMQNRADAGAMAGAMQLDGRAEARARATAVAVDAMDQISRIPGDGQAIDVQAVNFFSAYAATPVAATEDADSRFIEVILNPKRVDLFLTPILDRTATPHSRTLGAMAVAGANPFICHAPPLMICDPGETDPSEDIASPANAGRQIRLKPPPGGSAWAPGNYGLLALPDGSKGASDIESALAAVEPAGCYTLDVGTAPGGKTNKVRNGINARFDVPGGLPYPAPNVINYPADAEIESDPSAFMGSGDWDIGAYWAAKHAGPLPVALQGASRYQVYLWELGLEYARNGRRTIHPVTGALPDGFALVTPPAADVPSDLANPDDPDFDGVPSQTVAANGFARRLLQIAVLQCVASGVRGHHTYPTHGNFLEAFITEAVDDEPKGGIYVEFLRGLTPANDPDFHANVGLVQ